MSTSFANTSSNKVRARHRAGRTDAIQLGRGKSRQGPVHRGIYPVCDLQLSRAEQGSLCVRHDAGGARKAVEGPQSDRSSRTAGESGLPILHIHGDKDGVVPLEKNSQVVLDRYKVLGGKMELIVVPGKGHAEIPEYFQEPRLVQFLSDGGSRAAEDAATGSSCEQGGEITESKGVITAVTFKDASKSTDVEFEQMTRLRHLKMLSFSNGLNDARLTQLANLAALEYLQTNLAQITDDGVKPLAKLKNLKNLKFFHPGKSFSGAGLCIVGHAESRTGSPSPARCNSKRRRHGGGCEDNEAQGVCTWRCGCSTNEGVKKLKELKNLKSLYLGQRLTYKLPARPTERQLPSWPR